MNPDPTIYTAMGGEVLRPPPQPPSRFFIFFKHHRIQKIYTCIPPSLIQVIALGMSIGHSVVPQFFFSKICLMMIQRMYTCIHPSLIQLVALCISFFVYLILCGSCNVLVSVHQTPWGGGRCALPPNPPAAFLYFFKHHRIQKIYTCIPPSLIQVIALGMSIGRSVVPQFFSKIFLMMIQKMYTCIHPSLIQLIALCISFFVCLTLCRSCNVLVSVHQMPWGEALRPPPNPPPAFWT